MSQTRALLCGTRDTQSASQNAERTSIELMIDEAMPQTRTAQGGGGPIRSMPLCPDHGIAGDALIRRTTTSATAGGHARSDVMENEQPAGPEEQESAETNAGPPPQQGDRATLIIAALLPAAVVGSFVVAYLLR
jgi:hypothetical protein